MKKPFIATLAAMLVGLLSFPAEATVPPPAGSEASRNPVLRRPLPTPVKRGLKNIVRRVWAARAASPAELNSADPALQRKFRVSGTVEIPVLLVSFANTPKAPVEVAQYQQQLFDGPWPTGTLTEYYRTASYGSFELRGQVFDWKQLPLPDEFYEGADFDYQGESYPCLGRCSTAQIARFVTDAIAAHSGTIDWGRYDNDGPDGKPNSGDDNGYVDFVAIVHAEAGSECPSNENIWSQQYRLSGYGAPLSTGTRSLKPGAGDILIDEYAVIAGLDCNSENPNPIGVMAHEFAHAFGLPDLYDTNDLEDGVTSGVGRWCLMGQGGLTPDGTSASRPVQLSPWARAALGWLDFQDINSDTPALTIPNVDSQRVAYRVVTSPGSYYVLVNGQKEASNTDLPGSGLQIWNINEPLIQATIVSNEVNTGPKRKGVDLVEADGKERLDSVPPVYWGSEDDVFPGTQNARHFDETTSPRTWGSFAVCEISDSSSVMTVKVLRSKAKCEPPFVNPPVVGPPTP